MFCARFCGRRRYTWPRRSIKPNLILYVARWYLAECIDEDRALGIPICPMADEFATGGRLQHASLPAVDAHRRRKASEYGTVGCATCRHRALSARSTLRIFLTCGTVNAVAAKAGVPCAGRQTFCHPNASAAAPVLYQHPVMLALGEGSTMSVRPQIPADLLYLPISCFETWILGAAAASDASKRTSQAMAVTNAIAYDCRYLRFVRRPAWPASGFFEREFRALTCPPKCQQLVQIKTLSAWSTS